MTSIAYCHVPEHATRHPIGSAATSEQCQDQAEPAKYCNDVGGSRLLFGRGSGASQPREHVFDEITSRLYHQSTTTSVAYKELSAMTFPLML